MVTRTVKSLFGRLFPNSKKSRNSPPRRLAQQQHGIDKRKVSRHAIKVCEVLQEQGYQAFIVGGAVRDLIVGIEPTDFDVATNATPEQIRPLFRRARIIGRRFQLVHVVFGREIIETSTFRASSNGNEAKDEHGRILRDNLFGTQKEDAERRDFTLNALYYDPVKEEVIDFHNGVDDIKKRVVRMIGDPETRYREDPVRMLRAIRFAAKLDARIDNATLAPILGMARLINNVPASRLFDEMLKLLTCGQAVRAVQYLRDQGLHTCMLPQIDTVLDDPDGARFIEMALQRTDVRIRTGNTVSPGFLFASLLWKLVKRKWEQGVSRGEHSIQALGDACDEVLALQGSTLAIHRRFQADMREIWMMQPRFERFTKKALWRMTEHPRFRAGVGFLQLRAEAREVDSVLAQWWADVADAEYGQRVELVEAWYKTQPASAQKPTARRRRPRRRKPRSADGAADQAGAQSDGSSGEGSSNKRNRSSGDDHSGTSDVSSNEGSSNRRNRSSGDDRSGASDVSSNEGSSNRRNRSSGDDRGDDRRGASDVSSNEGSSNRRNRSRGDDHSGASDVSSSEGSSNGRGRSNGDGSSTASYKGHDI